MRYGPARSAVDRAAPFPCDEPPVPLDALPCFSALTADQALRVQESCRCIDPAPGEIVVTESQPIEALYVVERGQVRLFRTSRLGREQVLFILGPGDTFNEEVIGDDGLALASAQAAEPHTRLYALPVSMLLELLASNAQFATQIACQLAQRVRRLAGLVEDFAFSDTAHRVSKLLLEESAGTGMVLLTKQEMAARVGAAREVVSRVLHNLEQAGLIRRRHDGIVYVHAHALREHPAYGR